MTSTIRFLKITNLIIWLPALIILVLFMGGYLSFEPIRAAQQWMGRVAIVFLVLNLAVTPMAIITGIHSFSVFRRPLGLAACYYALIHLFIYIGLDLQFEWKIIAHVLSTQPFLWVGLSGSVILIILGITSFKQRNQSLGKYWKWIHQLVYPGSILAIIHYAMARKGNILTLQGDTQIPIIMLILTLVLLSFRLRFVQNWFIKLRRRD
jgi:sulfoxide reductase heme-binding subunit YedZ